MRPHGGLAQSGVKLGRRRRGARGCSVAIPAPPSPPASPRFTCWALWTVSRNTHHLEAPLQVPAAAASVAAQICRLLRLPASLGCNFIAGIECVQDLFIVQRPQDALPGAWGELEAAAAGSRCFIPSPHARPHFARASWRRSPGGQAERMPVAGKSRVRRARGSRTLCLHSCCSLTLSDP